MWPTVFVVDKNGYLRHWWQGELNWKGATGDKTIEQVVELALAEPNPSKYRLNEILACEAHTASDVIIEA